MVKKNKKDNISIRRKFQVSNGYLLEFDQLARILHFLNSRERVNKVSREELMEETGLANRQLESLVSVGAAMGIIIPGKQILSPIGQLIAAHDIFLENPATLEWCHYVGAGSYKNLIWFEIFNQVLPENSMSQQSCMEHLRQRLAGQYTDRTIGKHLYEEVRFVVDAYIERNFKKLELLHLSQDDKLYMRRYSKFEPLILCAMLYDFGDRTESRLLQLKTIPETLGSPARIFNIDTNSLRQLIEQLHQHGWVRYESTHNLDQIRLLPGYETISFLKAYFDSTEPIKSKIPQSEGLFE